MSFDTREDKNRHILTKIEHVLHQNLRKSNIPPVQNLTLPDKTTKVIPVKLPELEISKFDGNILNWHGFWDQFQFDNSHQHQ